jgi:cytochrome c
MVAALLAVVGPACADVQRGQQIAQQRCAACHATDATSDSPHKITPPFRDLHLRFPIEMLVEAARSGVVEGHDEMPMFQFSPQDATALVRYIDSLSPENARYFKK